MNQEFVPAIQAPPQVIAATDAVTARLAVRRFGLHFPDDSTEADYQSWRIDVAIPFVRVGMIASVLTWLGGSASSYLMVPDKFMQVVPWVLGLVLPAILLALGITFLPRLRTAVMPVTALANSIAGLAGIWMLHEVYGVPGAVSAGAIMVAYFAFTIFRLPPLLASLAVAPYMLQVMYYLVGDRQALRLGAEEYWAYMFMPIITTLTGVLVCVVLEIITRQAYRSERIIAHQQQALIEERAHLSRFLSPEVTRMVRERGIDATLVQQTLELTAVCCDLRGFTTYTERNGAQQMALVLRAYYQTIVEVAKRYGGTVKDFAGDGALILVGAPIARPDHAVAGLNLARDLIKAVKRITDAFGGDGIALGVGAGVATGACAVGAIGSQSRLEYTAVGSAVNLASRLCGRAGDGEVLIAPATAAQVGRLPGWRVQPMELKGFAEPVPVLVEPQGAG